MAKKNTVNSTDTSRDQEISPNTPSGVDQSGDYSATNQNDNQNDTQTNDQTSTTQGQPSEPANAANDDSSSTETEQGSDTNTPDLNAKVSSVANGSSNGTSTASNTNDAKAADPGIELNEKIGQWKEEAKRKAAAAKQGIDSLINYLDDLG